MKYIEYKPDQVLKDYIDVYWVLQAGPVVQFTRRPVFADACMEIFINLGNSRPAFNGNFTFSPRNIYIVVHQLLRTGCLYHAANAPALLSCAYRYK